MRALLTMKKTKKKLKRKRSISLARKIRCQVIENRVAYSLNIPTFYPLYFINRKLFHLCRKNLVECISNPYSEIFGLGYDTLNITTKFYTFVQNFDGFAIRVFIISLDWIENNNNIRGQFALLDKDRFFTLNVKHARAYPTTASVLERGRFKHNFSNMKIDRYWCVTSVCYTDFITSDHEVVIKSQLLLKSIDFTTFDAKVVMYGHRSCTYDHAGELIAKIPDYILNFCDFFYDTKIKDMQVCLCSKHREKYHGFRVRVKRCSIHIHIHLEIYQVVLKN